MTAGVDPALERRRPFMDERRARSLLMAERERLRAALQSPEMTTVAGATFTDSMSDLAEVDQHPAVAQ